MRPAASSSLETGRKAGWPRIVISRRVRILKIVLPLIAVAMAGIATMNILGNAGIGPTLPPLEFLRSLPTISKMHNPHYQGFNDDGGHYWVKAETAQQDLKTLTAIHLQGITGELTDAKKQKTHLVATRGLFDNKSNILELYDSIDVTGDGGLTAKLTRATVRTKEDIITSDQPSTIVMGAGTITSNQLTVRQKSKEYTFVDTVRTHMKPKEAPPAADNQTAQQALPFGKPGEPVDVASNRLDIDDVKKTAFYTGEVVATQAGATMTSPEMTVTYEGHCGSGTAEARILKKPRKIPKIQERKSSLSSRGIRSSLRSRTAKRQQAARRRLIRPPNHAVLEGDVVLTQGDDKKR